MSADEFTSPGFIAHISLVIARESDEVAAAKLSRSVEVVEIRANGIDDLATKLSQYALHAVVSIGDPGAGTVGVALDSAVMSGTRIAAAAVGAINQRD